MDMIRKTLKKSTCLAKLENRLPMTCHIKSRNPQLNVSPLRKLYATDTIFGNMKLYEGYNASQVFGRSVEVFLLLYSFQC